MMRTAESLKDQLNAFSEEVAEKAPPKVLEIYERGIVDVAKTGILERALKAGDPAPRFELPNARGNRVSLDGLLRRGPVVLVWYRGGWCPYCSLQLRAMQEVLPEIAKRGASLAAITPELPDHSLATTEKNALGFEVLSDAGNHIAERFGIAFKIPADVADIYRSKFSLLEYNGDGTDVLPLAAAHIIDRDGMIAWTFLHADYRKRAEPAEIIDALDDLG